MWSSFPVAAALLVAACRTAPSGGVPTVTPTPLGPPPAAAEVLRDHLSPQEARELAVIRWIHEGSGIIQRFRDSGALADSVEWTVPGPPDVLPFAGTWHGLAGIAEFQQRLDATMRYDRVELREYLASANTVAAVFRGEGIARGTGRPFRSEIVRVYTFDPATGLIVRVRNFYDTDAYVAAMRGDRSAAARREGAHAIADRADSLARRFAANRSDRALFAAAIHEADSALTLDSTVVAAHVARGVAFAAAGRPRDAALAYRHALQLSPDDSRIANAALGQFWRAGMYDEAYRWGKRQAEREPTNLSVLFNFNVACGFLVEPARAESLMVRALAVDPRFATAHGELAFLAQYAGRRADAVTHMRAALAIDSTSAENVGGMAQMLVPVGKARQAVALLAPVVAQNPAATAYGGRSLLAIHGWALREAGDSAAAREVLSRALTRLRDREKAGETTYQLFREMAAVQAILGKRSDAIASLRRAADAGMHTYASWELSDPMFASIRDAAEVQRIVARMREDTRRMRKAVGLS